MMFPNPLHFFLAEWKAAGWWYGIRSKEIREAPVDYIHFKCEPIKVAP